MNTTPPRSSAHAASLAFASSVDQRLLHILIAGKTGQGKSTLLAELALEDARSGRGLLLVDPHGDLVSEVLAGIPRHRKNDIVLFNATDSDSCPGLNPLRTVPPRDRALVVSNILATMKKLWGAESWGPRTEHLLRHALLALTEVRGATLADARALFVDPKRRDSILAQVRDPHVVEFWAREFVGYGKSFQAEITAAPLNKLGALLASGVVREIVTKTRPRIDARKLLDRGAIVLASLPKGRIGEDATVLLGGLLLGAFQQAAVGRADVPAPLRRPFLMLVDEVGSFATPPLVGLVAEARKFAVGLVLATQSLAVLEPPVRHALLGNVGTLVSFRAGAEDAEIVSREFAGEIAAESVMRLAVGEMAVKSGTRRAVIVPPHAG